MSDDLRCPTPIALDRPLLLRRRAERPPFPRSRRRLARARALRRGFARRVAKAPWQPPPVCLRVAVLSDMDDGPPGDDHTAELIRQALSGNSSAMNAVGARLRHVVHKRVATTLLKSRHAALNSSLRHDIEDLVQDVFCFLFEKGLAKWEPGGLSLEGWANLLARNYVIDRLRGRLRLENNVGLTDDDAIFDIHASSGPTEEQLMEDADFAWAVIKAAKAQLSALDAEMLGAFLAGQTAAEVAQRTGRSLAAVEKQRARLLERIREIAEELRRHGGGKS